MASAVLQEHACAQMPALQEGRHSRSTSLLDLSDDLLGVIYSKLPGKSLWDREGQPAPPAPVLRSASISRSHLELEHIKARFQNSYVQMEDICMQDVMGVECTVKGVETIVPSSPSTQLSAIPDDTTSPWYCLLRRQCPSLQSSHFRRCMPTNCKATGSINVQSYQYDK
eukprot:913589-Pelagomonas_calceolata.AAC.1